MIEEETPRATPAEAPRRRRKLPWSFVVAGLAVAGALAYLIAVNTAASAAYYMSIQQLRACHDCSSRIVRVAGAVQANSIVRDNATQTVRFNMVQGADVLPVSYSGIVPDIFRAGITVVVEGKPGTSPVFHAQTLLAKCPSKFQNATPGASQP
ncbi:MAG TPA: cytochrome c maturation protein CcmE [Ktedonobacterales bacterium]